MASNRSNNKELQGEPPPKVHQVHQVHRVHRMQRNHPKRRFRFIMNNRGRRS